MGRLSKTQEKLAHQKDVGISVIKGGEKSGKTAVGMARMLYLLEHACPRGEQVLFVAPNKLEAEAVRSYLQEAYNHQNLSLFDEARGVANVYAMEELTMQAAKKVFVGYGLKQVELPKQEIILEAMHQLKKQYPKSKWLRAAQVQFVCDELQWMEAYGIDSLEAYLIASRKHRPNRLPKKGSGRQVLWALKQCVDQLMQQNGYMTSGKKALETLKYLREDQLKHCYTHMIIDDAEKLTKVELEILGCLRCDKAGELLFLMHNKPEGEDLGFLTKGQSFKAIGYDMTGRTRHLVSRIKKVKSKKAIVNLTPLEELLMQQSVAQNVVSIPQKGQSKLREKPKAKLPWYVETYRYINKITGVETVFQKDNSAQEVYIDEEKQEMEMLPVYSDIAAGLPIEIVDEMSGKFSLPSELLHHKKNTYILHVQGDSMIGANIDDGDYVVIQAGNVSNHEIAAIYYNGSTTLKRIVQEEEHILLVSENPKYKPIVIEEGDFHVMGKLVGVIKNLT